MRWTPKEAAAAWNCSVRTAQRLMKREPAAREAGAPKPMTKRGNPYFGTSEFSRAQAARRWEGHVSKTEARLIIKGLIALEVEAARAQLSEYLGDSAQPVEDWEPYPHPDEIDYPEDMPHYDTQKDREAAERKAARKKGPRP